MNRYRVAEFTRAVNKARIAFQEGNAAELKKLEKLY